MVTVATTALTLILSAMAGYAFARIPFRGKRIAFPLVLAGLMVPKEAMFIPLFLIFADFDQHNTYQALVLPRIAAPLGVFIMTQFFSAIPDELEEAAVIDGASRWKIFWKIMLPMSVPALTALGIFTFVLTWNDFLWPLVSATDPDNFTITTGLASRQGNFAQANALGDLMAQGVFASVPLLILFFIFQRQIIRGISLGSGGQVTGRVQILNTSNNQPTPTSQLPIQGPRFREGPHHESTNETSDQKRQWRARRGGADPCSLWQRRRQHRRQSLGAPTTRLSRIRPMNRPTRTRARVGTTSPCSSLDSSATAPKTSPG